MALTDNTETLEQILQEVYELPNRSSGGSVDATINVVVDDGMNATPTTLTIDNIQYDEGEIVNIANKLHNNEDVNVKIYGEYNRASSSGFYGNFKPLHVLYKYPNVVVTFMLDYDGTFVMYRLIFDVEVGDDYNVASVTSAVLDRINSRADATIYFNTGYGEYPTDMTSEDLEYDEYEIINAFRKADDGYAIDIRIEGFYRYSSDGGYTGTFRPLLCEAQGDADGRGTLEVVFVMKGSTGLEVMTITFNIGTDSTVTSSVTTNS